MEFLTFEQKGKVGVITINRPKALNALNTAVYKELDELFTSNIPTDVHCLIITGSGEKSFVAGADISEMKDKNVQEGKLFSNLSHIACRKIETFRCPVIAAVNGFALGGGTELALSCDIRLAAENAKFGQPEVGLGITPGCGGTQRLPRLVGSAVAKELVYTGKIIRADEAYRIGLVNHVYPQVELMNEALKMAETIANQAPVAVSLSKELINDGLEVDIDTAINMEANSFAQCFATEDQKMAMTAFVNKTDKEEFKNK